MAVDSAELYAGDIKSVLLSEEQIRTRTVELAEMIAEQYRDDLGNDDLLLVTVLKGAGHLTPLTAPRELHDAIVRVRP